MKRLFITVLLLGIVSSCNTDDIDSDFIVVSAEEAAQQDNCTTDASNPPSILGSTYFRTSYILETAVDGNGDGVFSFDLKDEGLCSADAMTFSTNFRVWNPESSFVSLQVANDAQAIYCSHADGTLPIYIKTGTNVDFCFGGEIRFSGTLSDNENTLTIQLPYDQLYGFFLAGGGNDILLPDGTIEQYQGGATLVYERQ